MASKSVTADGGGEAAKTKTKVFISYSRKDMAFADRLETALNERGLEPLVDRTEIYAFEDWWQRIQALIAQADTIIFLLSPDAVASEVCAKEIAFAASLNKRFAPIVVRRVDNALVPEALARLNFIFFDDAALFADSVEQLCDALGTDIEWIRKHTQYGEAARHWAAGGRAGGLLLRSPALEESERWIVSRPSGAPAPTEETQAFVTESRRGATRRRNRLTAGLAAGLAVALVLAGLAYWQRGVALNQQRIAEEQRGRAERTLALATRTANGLVFDLAQKFRDVVGVPVATIKDILDRARQLQDQLLGTGESSPALRFSQAAALGEVSSTLLALGETQAALAAAKQDQDILRSLVAAAPGNTDFQLNLSVADFFVGNVQLAQGDLPTALASYQASLAIRDRLVKSDPRNTDWRHYLAVAYDRVGLVLLDQGNLSAARASYQAAHDIVEDLARSEPDKTLWQDDLAMANERLGIVQMAQGDLSAALSSYQQRLDIAERLAKSDPGKGSWQRELSQAYSRIGDVQMAQGNLPAALSSYQACLAVITPLARSDPGNTGWQRDLAIAYAMLGNAQRAQGDLPAALGSYQSSIDIDRRLADANPGNADWQNDMSITYNRIGDVRLAQDDLPAALASYQASLAIIEPLAKSDRSNVGWQRDLVASYLRVGNVLFRLGRPQEAVDRFGAAIETGKAVDPSAIYLRRAVAEIVMSDFAASAKDAATALQLKPTEPYSALWLHVARVLAGQNDADELAANAGKIDRGKWPGPVFALFLGSMDPDAIRKLAASAEPQGARLGQLCEADYFIGIYQIEKSQPAAARASFQSASDRCPHGFYEYTAAKFELTRLDNPAGAQTKQ